MFFMYPILLFVLSSVIIVIAAMKLTYYGDAIAETTDLGHSLVGIILLSAATSLPELFSSSTSAFHGNVDLSFGNVFGSNMTNIFILVIMDLYVRGYPILLNVSQRNIMTGGIVIFVTCITLLMIYLGNLSALKSIDFWFFSPILLFFYIGGMIFIYHFEKSNGGQDEIEPGNEQTTLTKKQAILGFVISSIIVFGSAILLTYSCDQISQFKISGKDLGGTFVGTLFLAFTTSLPEIVVSISALKVGSHNMALGNLFGSNLFNLAILSFSDGFYRLGGWVRGDKIITDAFTKASLNHMISGLIGILFIGIVLSSLMLRKKIKKGPLGIDTAIIGVFYISVLYLLFILR